MPPARGDSKRCTHADCSGTMQFGREVRLQTQSATIPDGEPGWNCSEDRGHFELTSESARHKAAPSAAPQARARWDDDGGATTGGQKIGPQL